MLVFQACDRSSIFWRTTSSSVKTKYSYPGETYYYKIKIDALKTNPGVTSMARASLSRAFLPCWKVDLGKNKSPEPPPENER